MVNYVYSFDSLIKAYKALGIKNGDFLFVTTGLGFLGAAKGVTSLDELCKLHLSALNHVVGLSGGLVVPTYSYTFGSTTPSNLSTFNRRITKPKIGPFPNYVLNCSSFERSIDPMVSCSISGESWQYLIANLPHTSYGYDSLYERLLSTPTKLLSIGLGPNWTPFLHHLDYINCADYRYDKLFYGIIDDYNDSLPIHWNYSVSCMLPRGTGNCQKLGYLAELSGIWSSIEIGKSCLYSCSYSDYFEFAQKNWRKHTWLTTMNHPQLFTYQAPLWTLAPCTSRSTSYPEPLSVHSNTYLNPLTGLSLKPSFDSLANSLQSSRIDFISLNTGSNLGDYVLPETWEPLLLEVSSNEKTVFKSNDIDTIRRLVLPHSKSIYLTANINDLESYYLDSVRRGFNLASSQSVIYAASNTPLFVISDEFTSNLGLTSYSTIDINFSANTTYSTLEALIITPQLSNKDPSKKISIIDTVSSLSLSTNTINLISNLIASNHSVILAPALLAPLIYELNYAQDGLEYELINLSDFCAQPCLEDVNKISFNTTSRPDCLSINTLDFCLT